MVLDGMPLYRDEGHISEYASIRIQMYFNDWAKGRLSELFNKI
jgi:hypothetical protein